MCVGVSQTVSPLHHRCRDTQLLLYPRPALRPFLGPDLISRHVRDWWDQRGLDLGDSVPVDSGLLTRRVTSAGLVPTVRTGSLRGKTGCSQITRG